VTDPTAQTEPLTLGQKIVAAYETDMIAEPCELAAAIDKAVEAEREACAKVAEGGSFLHDASPAAHFGRECAAAIRRRSKS
jgi:hypothetical protein